MESMMKREFLSYFDLEDIPFTSDIPTKQRVKFSHVEEEIRQLKNIIHKRQSAAIIAPAGVGKSLVLRTLKEEMSGAHIEFIYIKIAKLGLRDMTKEIAFHLNIEYRGGTNQLLNAIEKHFSENYIEKYIQHVLIFEDAHELKENTISLIKGLTNFQMDSKLILSILLCGHEKLRKTLSSPKFEDIDQRMNYYATLRTLTKEETTQYIKLRLKNMNQYELFTENALDCVYEYTQGNMRAINRIALLAMEYAFLKKIRNVHEAEVQEAGGILCQRR